jgi:hypothetical protein
MHSGRSLKSIMLFAYGSFQGVRGISASAVNHSICVHLFAHYQRARRVIFTSCGDNQHYTRHMHTVVCSGITKREQHMQELMDVVPHTSTHTHSEFALLWHTLLVPLADK